MFVETKYVGYFISQSGDVISFKTSKRGVLNQVDYNQQPRVLTFSKTRMGYKQLIVSQHQHIKSVLVHRLVWETFNGSIPDGLQVDHIDGNNQNNNLANLQLLTLADNVKKANCGRRSKFCKHVKLKLNDDVYHFVSINDFDKNGPIDKGIIYRARRGRYISNNGNLHYIILSYREDSTTIEIEVKRVE